jgi:hypothetical protein
MSLPNNHAETVIAYRLHCYHLGIEPVEAPNMYPRAAATTPNQNALWEADNLWTNGARALPDVHAFLDKMERGHMDREQGGYRGLWEVAFLSLVRPAIMGQEALVRRVHELLSRHASYAALCDPGDRVSRIPGPRLGDEFGRDGERDAVRDAVEFGRTYGHTLLTPLDEDAAVKMARDLVRSGELPRLPVGPRYLPSLVSPLIVEVYTRGRRAWVERFEDRVQGGPVWGVASDAAGRQESVTWRDVPGVDGWEEAKRWGGRTKSMPGPLPLWPAMGPLLETWELGPDGARRIDPSQPTKPPPKPPKPPKPVKPKPPKPRRPKPPKPPSEPAEDTIAGDHEWEHLEGGRPKQCRRCYHGREQHPMPGRVPRRVPDDTGKRPPGRRP